MLYECVLSIRQEYFENINFQRDLNSLSYAAKCRLFLRDRISNSNNIPAIYKCSYSIRLVCPDYWPVVPIHQIKSKEIGRLLKVSGVVLQVTNVRPRMTVAAYYCESCNERIFVPIDFNVFCPLTTCTSTTCVTSGKKGTLILSYRESKLVMQQMIVIQELPQNIPSGSLPKSLKLVLKNDFVHAIKPGMTITVSGIYTPDSKARGVVKKLFNTIEAVVNVTHVEFPFDDFPNNEDFEKQDFIKEIQRKYPGRMLYEMLAASLAPSIYGHEEIKKTLLLQLVGGTNVNTGDSLKIRGDIHVLLIGDPGIAKSQLLKRINNLYSRSNYTCGKGTSSVGLTASIVRDPLTSELMLEGGAVVLTDKGICCIDEFDKMDEKDRTAIHEVMEQQTVSVSKAGLIATLNARTRILAAANPINSRYNVNRTAVQNIGLPAALLTRFDVVFLVLDTFGDKTADLAMAKHILNLHKGETFSHVGINDINYPIFSTNDFRKIIRATSSVKAYLSPEVVEQIINYYVESRIEEYKRGLDLEELTYITPRTLLSIIRLSQGLAKLRFSSIVETDDVNEAIKLVVASKESVSKRRKATAKTENNKNLRYYQMLKDYSKNLCNEQGWILFDDMLNATQDVINEDIELLIDALVASGEAMWDSIERNKFRFI
uniref:DNA replication licensing factor MCM4 n=1 Tax=Dermatophagoides pteronyssinus TaxID=6956 RepID=A0A6P6YBS8_DERPT|nr:DNA replication licensing factor MCM7-like [Dermatophagoides pteronyssinus]